MGKLKTWWPEIVFFAILLIIGYTCHGENNYTGWGGNVHYLDITGRSIIPAWILRNSRIMYSVFWLGTIFIYLLSFELFKNRKWAILTVAVFYFNPILIWAAFSDVENGPLIAFLAMGFYVLIRFIKKPSFGAAILLGLINVLTFIIHPVSLMIPFVTAGIFMLNLLTGNVAKKHIWKMLLYVIVFIALIIFIRFGLNYSTMIRTRFYMPFFYNSSLYRKLTWIVRHVPVLWVLYFIFSIVALNVVYFSNYFQFLKNKWFYTYLFVLGVAFILAKYILPAHTLMIMDKYYYLLPSVIILGIGGCYEFSLWVRKRWGEKVYFIFKYTFLIVFTLQCLWCFAAIIWYHPNYYLFKNWPLFW
jgi:hypothetical protein